MRERKAKDWAKGLMAAAPSQDPSVLLRVYGCVISPCFLRRVQGKEPRPCTNYKPCVNRYACRPRKFRNEDLRDVPRWGVPEMHMYQNDVDGAFTVVGTQRELQPYLIEDIGPPPPGYGPHLPQYMVPLSLNFGFLNSPELFDSVAKSFQSACRRENLPC